MHGHGTARCRRHRRTGTARAAARTRARAGRHGGAAHHRARAPGRLEDVSFYTDEARFAQERAALFDAMPIVACLSCELARPGSFRTFDALGTPLLIVRGRDGQARAFLNVCPHRGARIAREACGTVGRFTCRFHGWTFDTAGRAIGIPEEGYFDAAIDGRRRLIDGATESEAVARSGMDLSKIANVMPARDVAELALAAIGGDDRDGPTFVSSEHYAAMFDHLLSLPRGRALLMMAEGLRKASVA